MVHWRQEKPSSRMELELALQRLQRAKERAEEACRTHEDAERSYYQSVDIFDAWLAGASTEEINAEQAQLVDALDDMIHEMCDIDLHTKQDVCCQRCSLAR